MLARRNPNRLHLPAPQTSPKLEHMFVYSEVPAAGQPHRRLRHVGLRDRVTRDHCNQVIRAENLSPRPIAHLCRYRWNVRDSPVTKTTAEAHLRRLTDRTTGLPECAGRSKQATSTDRLPSSSGDPLPLRPRAGHYSHIMVKRRLRIDGEPPYIVMVFPAERVDATGVGIRAPRGIDVIPGRLLQWSPGDVRDECIDRDIPTAALGGLEWRP